MCEPATATAALAIASAASTAASVYTQQQTANAQAASNQRQYDATMMAYRANLANADWMKTQEADNLSQKRWENQAQLAREISKATVAAGEAGVGGASVDALLAELRGNTGEANALAEVNYLRRDRAIEMDRMNAWSNAASGINSLKTPQEPDYLGAALRIGTTAADYYYPKASDIRAKRT